MAKHKPNAHTRIVDVLGNFFTAVAIGFVGGMVVFFLFFAPTVINPVEQYCRGGVDAAMYYGKFPEEDREMWRETCITSTRTGVTLPNADGPIGADRG